MTNNIEPTFSTLETANIVAKSRAWVTITARDHDIGTLSRHQWRFTRRDVPALRRVAATIKQGNPNWLPGVPQPLRRKKKID